MTAQHPILTPTDAPTAISETTSAPPSQSVTVVVSPTAIGPQSGQWLRWTSLGALMGLVAGLLFAAFYHSKLPGEFESTARLQVSGPPPAGDAETQIAILRSKAVIERAAQKLDELRPFEMPPPKADAARVEFLEKGLKITAEIANGGGSTLNVTFRGPHRADTPKYLRAIVDAYKTELATRPASPLPVATPGAKPLASPVPQTTAQLDAEPDRLKKELAALSKDEPAAIESRLTASRASADQVQLKLHGIDRDLASIRATGASRRDRLATIEELGLKPDSNAVSPGTAAEVRAAEESLRTLQLKKAELGQRLGPEHRDIVALDQQMKLTQQRIAKLVPEAKGPDELDRHLVKLEADRTSLAAQVGVYAAAMAADQKLLGEVNVIRERLNELAANRPPPPVAPKESRAAPDAPIPTTFAVQAVVPTGEGDRSSPPLYRSLVPGGLIGLFTGALLGLIGSLLFAGTAKPTRPSNKGRIYDAPPATRSSYTSIPIASGPRLGVPVFANVPSLRADLPPEKRSIDGLSPLLVAFSQPSGPEAEVFRNARRELTNSLQNRGHQVVPITSPGPGDGKSLIAANLAISLAQSGKRVILVDCDLKSAKMQELFRLPRLGDSLKSIMAAEVDLRMAVRTCEVPNLFLLPAGRGPMDPVDLLTRPKFRELMAELRASYEYVIIDAPSTLAEKEFAVLAAAADGVVLVVRSGSDALSRSDRARGQVMEAGARVLGAIVNAAPHAPPAAAQLEPKALAAAK